MAYINNNGQVRIGVRAAIVNSPITQPTISASLLQALYGVWNGDTITNELGTSLYGVWNAEYSGTSSLETSLYGVWNGESTTNTLDTSIYALYKAEGNANDSIGTNHGTLMNGATFSTGKIGTKSFYFDGVNDYISLPNNSLNFTGDFSISVWVDVSSISTWSNSFNVINNASGNYGWRLVINGNSYAFYIGNGSAITQLYLDAAYDSIAQISPLVGSAMKNVVITRKAGVGTKMYINGVLKLSNTSTVNPSYLATMTPKFGDGNTITKLDNICFWNKELSDLEAIQLYNNNVGVDYPFNGNLLQSTNDNFSTNHGTLMNGTTFTTGKIGNAFSFDGVNDYVELPSTSLRMTGDFTISCWVYMNAQSTYHAFVENFYATNISNRYGWALYYQSGKIRFSTYNVSTAITQGSTTISTGQWYHIVVTKTVSGSPKIYLNSVLESTTAINSPTTLHPSYDSNNMPRFGVDVDSGIWSSYLNGRLDSVNVWNRELSANEVSMLYNGSNGTQYQSGSFGLTQSSLDSFGTSHGINVGGVTYTTGKVGNSFTFNGTNAYVNFPTNSWNSTVGTDFSISLWVKFTSTSTQTIISNMSSPSINNWSGWEIRLISGRPIIHMWNNAGVAVGPQGSVISTNTWYHIVATRKKGSRTRIYMNGSLEQTDTTNTNDPSINGTYYPNIGHLQYASSGHWYYMANGSLIDSVNLWNREISADEVTQLYNSGTGAQYPFTGTFSSAGNQLGVDNGTLMNGCSLTTGKIGQSFTFDGVNDYVSLPTNSLSLGVDFSISLWVNLTSLSTRQCFVGNYNFNPSTGGIYGFRLFYAPSGNTSNTGGVRFDYGDGLSSGDGFYGSSSRALLTNNYLTTNTWYHIVVTKKSSSAQIYINGSLAASNTDYIQPTYSGNTYPTIGVAQYLQNQFDWYMSSGSKIDGVNIYQKELTQSEVTELYNSGNGKQITKTPIIQSGLILNLDASRKSSYTGTGTTWTDISGNSKNGTIFNSPIFGTAGDGSFLFNASNQQIRVGSVTSGLTLTYNMWIRLSTISQQMLFWDGSSADGNDFWTTLTTDGKIRTLINNTTYLTSNSSITANTWYNISIVTTSTGKSIYINGVLDSTDNTPILTRTGYSYLSIGYAFDGSNDVQGWMGGTNLRGNIGSFNIYNRSLSATEVLQNFNATKSRFGY